VDVSGGLQSQRYISSRSWKQVECATPQGTGLDVTREDAAISVGTDRFKYKFNLEFSVEATNPHPPSCTAPPPHAPAPCRNWRGRRAQRPGEGVILGKEDGVGAFAAGVPDGPDGFISLEGGVFIIILSRVG
jgi:hypothetical protein